MNLHDDLLQTRNRFNELAEIISGEFTCESMNEKDFETVTYEYFRLSYKLQDLKNKIVESVNMHGG